LFDALPEDVTFNTKYYRDSILTALLPLSPQVDGRRPLFIKTIPSPHSSTTLSFFIENKLQLAGHPPYSLDHFGHVKHGLEGMVLPSHEELLTAIREIVAAALTRPCRVCLTTG
jgi:hypothetical protein